MSDTVPRRSVPAVTLQPDQPSSDWQELTVITQNGTLQSSEPPGSAFSSLVWPQSPPLSPDATRPCTLSQLPVRVSPTLQTPPATSFEFNLNPILASQQGLMTSSPIDDHPVFDRAPGGQSAQSSQRRGPNTDNRNPQNPAQTAPLPFFPALYDEGDISGSFFTSPAQSRHAGRVSSHAPLEQCDGGSPEPRTRQLAERPTELVPLNIWNEQQSSAVATGSSGGGEQNGSGLDGPRAERSLASAQDLTRYLAIGGFRRDATTSQLVSWLAVSTPRAPDPA